VTVVERAHPAAPPRAIIRQAWVAPLAIFALSRVLEGLLIAAAAHDQPARDSDVGVVDTPAGPDPGYLAALSNWDGQWYSQIAHHGYPTELPREDGVVQQNAWAYYPLYPGLVRLVMAVSRTSFEVAAMMVSIVVGAVAVVVLYRLVEKVGGRFNALTTVAAVCVFPAAPVLQVGYTESLALLLVVVCLTLLRDRRFGWLIVATALLSLTRPIVLPLALVIAVQGAMRWRRRHEVAVSARELRGYAVSAGFAVVSFAIWPAVAGIVTGEPDAYFATQRAWILDEASGWPSWLAHLAQPGERGPAVLGLLALAVLVALVARRAARAWGPELRVWGVAYFVYLLGTTRPTSSIIRYSMLTVVPAWPALSEPGREPSRRTQAAVLAAIFVIALPLNYLWLRWFFIPHPGNLGYP
jgi:hypothetical protein